MSSTQNPISVSKSKSHASSSRFDEVAWFNKWHGFDVHLRHCHQAIQEIFDAGDTYWKSFDERVRKAVSQNRYGQDGSILLKFDNIIRKRQIYLKNPSGFLAKYVNFEIAYADAKFVKTILGVLISSVPRADPGLASKGKASVMPKLDSASRARAQPSFSSSAKALGSSMPKLDSSRMPSNPALSLTIPRTTSSLGTSRQVGSLLPARDTRPGPPTSSTSSSQQIFPDRSGMRRETRERRVLPPTVGPNGVIIYGTEERIHVNMQQTRFTEQVVHGRVVMGPTRYIEYPDPSGRFPLGVGGYPGGAGGAGGYPGGMGGR